MSVRLGQIQSQLLRLDALGERLAKSAGIKPQEFRLDQTPGRGGAVSSLPQRDLSLADFSGQLEVLSKQSDDRGDRLAILEAMLLRDHVKMRGQPSMRPVSVGWYSSNFGWRIDPFSGKQAFHEGVDFMADVGTPIVAAAGGVVVYSDYHPEYGNMVAIDHGNGLVSRYAHASRRTVKVGDVVLKGEKIAEVGTTGRSTGPHLHFEVRFRGAPQDPTRFLHLPG
jgi:murein DD-endopeptidase MepM/ murein hydrolase activator NlpD